jgi:hypothetical protein
MCFGIHPSFLPRPAEASDRDSVRFEVRADPEEPVDRPGTSVAPVLFYVFDPTVTKEVVRNG